MEQTIASAKAGTVNRETGNVVARPIRALILFHLAALWLKIRTGFWHARLRLSSDTAKPLDVERIARQLAVEKRAEEDARRNLPPSTEEVPCGTQREVIGFFTNLRRRARKQASEDAERLNRTLEQINIDDSLARLQDLPAECENRILRYVADSESGLNNAIERERNQKKHYDAFRKRNGLDRVASYPVSSYHFYLVVPLLVSAIAFALARTVETSSGGGAGVSLAWVVTLSAAVVVVPFMLGGSLLRATNHIGEFRRFTGWMGILLGLAAIVATAFYADFHIATLIANPDATNRDVLDAMRAAPIDVLSNVANWKGFGLVGLGGLLAMLLAYRSDDPYPGYGAVQRAYYRARHAREAAAAQVRRRINSLIDASGAEIASVSKDCKHKVRTYARLVEKSEQNPTLLSEYDIELEDACNMVLDRYRAANLAARQSAAPMSFAEHVCFNPDSDMVPVQHADGRHHVAELQKAMVELENGADSARQKLRALNLRFIDSLSEPQSADDDEAE